MEKSDSNIGLFFITQKQKKQVQKRLSQISLCDSLFILLANKFANLPIEYSVL